MAAPDLIEAARFLALLAPDERVTFQTFDDNRTRNDRRLSRILHGTLAEHAGTLADLNARGAGIFVMVNEGDCKGRSIGNVQRVRANFIDSDHAPIQSLLTGSLLRPHIVVESSRGLGHAYWIVADSPLDMFRPVQLALSERFSTDARVIDLPRVMRLPGFDHRKGAPFRSRLLSVNDAPPYTLAELVAAFDLDAPKANAPDAPAPYAKALRRTLPDVIPEGERNNTLLSLAAGLVRKGFDTAGVASRLQRINAERCRPQLCASEVDGIAAQASGYGSDGFAMLSHTLLDSHEWKSLAPPAHDIILLAFRRYDGFNNGNFALTFEDFAERDGFRSRGSFYRHRTAALASGILLHASEGSITQNGRKPDLFAIAPQWLPDVFAECEKRTMRKMRKTHSYIDKQALEIHDLVPVEGSPNKSKADRAA